MNLLMTCVAMHLVLSITESKTTCNMGGDGLEKDDDLLDIPLSRCGDRYPSYPAISTTPATTTPTTTTTMDSFPLFDLSLWQKPAKVIVGGVKVKKNSWPWMVALFRKEGPRKRFQFGASLISHRYLLTAAHVFPRGLKPDPVDYAAKIGAHDIDMEDDGEWFEIESIIEHPSFTGREAYDDLALIKLKRDVKFSEKAYPVCLPTKSICQRVTRDWKELRATGWGLTAFRSEKPSNILQEVTIPLIPQDDCNEMFANLPSKVRLPHGITNILICAGYKKGGKDACQGDSGGPLLIQMDNSHYVQVGVISSGTECAKPNSPGVYTRVSKFMKWIRNNTDI